MSAGEFVFRSFESGDEVAFRELNLAWIEKLFAVETADLEVLNDPVGTIIGTGGHILMATSAGQAVGCCALLRLDPHTFEVAKMTVSAAFRGAGVGRRLLTYVIDFARQAGAKRLYLESSPRLPDAVHLYETVGFCHLPPDRVEPSPYARSGVYMEMNL